MPGMARNRPESRARAASFENKPVFILPRRFHPPLPDGILLQQNPWKFDESLSTASMRALIGAKVSAALSRRSRVVKLADRKSVYGGRSMTAKGERIVEK